MLKKTRLFNLAQRVFKANNEVVGAYNNSANKIVIDLFKFKKLKNIKSKI